MKTLIRKSLLILCAGAFGIATANAALLAHWPLDTDATDATGNGHDGAVVGGIVNFGEAGANASTGTSAAFPDNGHIDVPFDAALNPAGDFTVALWANAISTGGFASPITSRDDVGGGTSTHGYILYNNSGGNWDFWTGDGDPGWDGLAGDPVAINTWTHVAITYDSATDTKTLWIDGAVSVSDNVPQSGPTQYSPNGTVESELLHIGAGQDDGLNFYFSGNIDDVGIWDEALTEAEIQSVMNDGIGGGGADPNLRAPGLLELTYDGVDGAFNIPINNTGATQDLVITDFEISGPDDANFSLVSVPGPIPPGGSDNIGMTFDPLGANGIFEVTAQITSDDSVQPVTDVVVRMTFHDPFVSGPTTIDFGTRSSSSGSETVNVSLENLGISTLNISDITLGGLDAANFSLGAFANIPGGGMADVELTFSPNGQEGSFSAELVIESDDPITPTLTIPIVARVEFSNPLIAHWPLDVDASDASGNGFDGTVVGGTVNFGQPGANAATGASASFPDNGHIDIPFDAALNPGEKGPGLSGSFTIALWANSSDNANFNSPFTSREDNGVDVNGPIIYNNPDGNWSYWAGNGGPPGAWNAINDGAVPLNTWQHVAVTYEASTMTRKMYVDGVEVINQVTGVSANTQRDSHIGAGQDDGNNFFWNGLIDDVGLFRVALTEDQILAAMNNGVASFNKTSKLPFSVEAAPGDMLTLRWDSQGGKLYNLRSVTDPSAPIPPGTEPPAPLEWPIFDGNADLAATAPENVLTIPRPADPERYFLIEEFNAPPMSVFSDDFEGGQGSWTTGVDDAFNNTLWEFGSPSIVGPAAANSGANCFGTNLSANYGVDSMIWLRSPEIDLTTAGGATLNYASWRDIELMFDSGTVNILNAADDSVLAVVQADIEGSSAGWEQVSVPIPAAALGNVIKLEFRFESDEFQNFIGWYVDDVVVTVP